ncbi:MAG: MFS transporter [Alphaproteobacteria bacterium]|nr:MAG: MFS transporter [Alphaproteobacteria bacterium]
MDDDHRQQCAELIHADQHRRHIITDLRTVETVTISRSVDFASGTAPFGLLCRDGAVAGDPRFWVFIPAASALQASHRVYYGFGTLYWRSLDFSDTAVGWLWAEGVLAEILLFWHGRRRLARLGPIGLMVLGGVAGGDRGSALFSLRRKRLLFMAALSAAGLVGAAVLGWTRFSPQPAWPRSKWAPQLLRTPRVHAVHRMGDRVIMKSFCVERAGQLQHLGRLLAELPGRNDRLLARSLVGEAGLPGIEGALRVASAGAAKMVDHRVLIAQDRILVARPKFAVDGIPASRADDHQIGLKQQRLLSFDIPRRIAIPVGGRRCGDRRGGQESRSQTKFFHRNSPNDVRDALSITKELSQFQEQQRSFSTNLKYKGLLFFRRTRRGITQPKIG